MRVRGEGLADDEGHGLDLDGRVMYVVHPNCAVEDM